MKNNINQLNSSKKNNLSTNILDKYTYERLYLSVLIDFGILAVLKGGGGDALFTYSPYYLI